MTEPQTIIDKLWAAHEILRRDDGESLLWVDRHYVHEGSFHAFGKLAARGVKVAEPGQTLALRSLPASPMLATSWLTHANRGAASRCIPHLPHPNRPCHVAARPTEPSRCHPYRCLPATPLLSEALHCSSNRAIPAKANHA